MRNWFEVLGTFLEQDGYYGATYTYEKDRLRKPGKKWKEKYNAPGLCKEWLSVNLKDQILTLTYKQPKDYLKTDSDFLSLTPWTLELKVDKEILSKDIKVKYQNGILLISCDSPERQDKNSFTIPVE